MNALLCATLSLVGMCGTQPLCVDGHPAARRPDVAYAGLPPKHGYQRDHRIPLCAGGPDTADNVEYEPLAEAKVKDHYEWSMCEAMCRGAVSQAQVWQFFDEERWRQQ